MIPRINLVLAIGVLVATASLSTAGSLRGEKVKTHGTNQASTRLMKELVEIYKSDSYKKGIIGVELDNDNLYEWNVKMYFTDPNCTLYDDLQQMKRLGKEDHVMIHLSFRDDYPNSPPFVRSVYPILDNLQYNGAICMHLLSPDGWFSACSTEALILSIMELMGVHNRVNFVGDTPEQRKSRYTPESARINFNAMMQRHGWDRNTLTRRTVIRE